MKSVAFFNNKGGVGKTTLVYHLAAMFADLGARVLAVDLDPQANLTSMSLDEERLVELWPDGAHERTLLGSIAPVMKGLGDICECEIEEVDPNFGLLAGDLALSTFEEMLSGAWSLVLSGNEAALRATSAFARIIESASERWDADLVLIDVGPNLGALNRAALIAAAHVVTPLAPDLFSLQGLRNLGPTLKKWRKEWTQRRNEFANTAFVLAEGRMEPLGYVILQHAVRLDRPVKAYGRWIEKIPSRYASDMFGAMYDESDDAPYELGRLKNFRSLMQLAQEAHRPMFLLRPGDGALGAQQAAVRECYDEFKKLAVTIANRLDVDLPVLRGAVR